MGVPSCSVDHDAKACFAHRASCAHIARALQEHPQTYLDATWHAVGSVFLRLGKVVCDQEAPNLEYVTMSEGAHLHAKLADIVHVWPGPGSVAPVKGDGSCGKAVWFVSPQQVSSFFHRSKCLITDSHVLDASPTTPAPTRLSPSVPPEENLLHKP